MKQALLAFTLLGALLVSSCDKEEEEHNHITVTIDHPLDGAVIAESEKASLEVKVTFKAEEELHDLEVIMHPVGDEQNLLINADLHTHETEHTFTQSVDLSSFDAGTQFHLEVMACEDHNCDEKVTAEASFKVE